VPSGMRASPRLMHVRFLSRLSSTGAGGDQEIKIIGTPRHTRFLSRPPIDNLLFCFS